MNIQWGKRQRLLSATLVLSFLSTTTTMKMSFKAAKRTRDVKDLCVDQSTIISRIGEKAGQMNFLLKPRLRFFFRPIIKRLDEKWILEVSCKGTGVIWSQKWQHIWSITALLIRVKEVWRNIVNKLMKRINIFRGCADSSQNWTTKRPSRWHQVAYPIPTRRKLYEES